MTKRIVALVVAIALVALAVPTEAGGRHHRRRQSTEFDIAMANVRQTFNTPLGYLYSGLSYDRYNPYSSWGNNLSWDRRGRISTSELAIGAAIIGGAVLLSKKKGGDTATSDDPEKCFKKVGKAMKVAKKYSLKASPDQLIAQCLGEPVATQPVATIQTLTTITALNATGDTVFLKDGKRILPNETFAVDDRTEMRSDTCALAYRPIVPGARALVCK